MNRRDFLSKATTASVALAVSGCNDSGHVAIDYSKHPDIKQDEHKRVNINHNKKTVIKLATSWPAHFPIMGTGVEDFAKRVDDISGGSLKVKIYPKNVLVPALAVFDATSSGQIDAFHSGPYYWKGKNSAFSLFGGMPFGFTADEMTAWMVYGDGLKIWREMYARYNLYPLLGGNTGMQMGGWFRKKITSIKDMQGLKMRIPGLGGEVMSKMGVNPILLPAGEIYTSLERGVIDATEWVGPALDLKMGFYKVAPYYYSGWHEPGSVLELTFNKHSWDKMSFEHRAMIDVASSEINSNIIYNFQSQNIIALQKLKELNVTILEYPDEVTQRAKKALGEVIDKFSSQNEDFKRVYDSVNKYLALSKSWSDVSTKYFLNVR